MAQPFLFDGVKRARNSKAIDSSPLPSSRFYKSSEIEQIYLNTVRSYTREQAENMSKLLALLISALDKKHQDFLGQIYSMLNLGNAKKGQFFTPYNVSKLMAEINIIEIENQLAERDFITLSEPCSGSGGIIIAFAEILKEKGYNYQHQLFVEAVDIDELCFMMTYIQLALYGIPARVILGDTLSLKYQKILYTPMYFINGFYWKLRKRTGENNQKEAINEVITKEIKFIDKPIQLQLFNS